MAEELRWENLTVGSGTVAFSAGAEFRNDSSRFIHIREISYAHLLTTAAPNESVTVQISKSPVVTTGASNNPFYAWTQRMASKTDVALDSAMEFNGGRKWAKGQLVLEPGESLFVNAAVVAGAATIQPLYEIGYTF